MNSGQFDRGTLRDTSFPEDFIVPLSRIRLIHGDCLRSAPDGVASLDLGGRLIEVVPIPGHNDNSIALFDHGSRILLSGDSMMRGKINVSDLSVFRYSVARLSRFIDDVAPRVILGGHLERTNVPLGLAPAAVGELAVLSDRVSFVRPFARGEQFTIVYLWPVFVAMGGGFLLLVGGLLHRLVRVVRRWRSHNVR